MWNEKKILLQGTDIRDVRLSFFATVTWPIFFSLDPDPLYDIPVPVCGSTSLCLNTGCTGTWNLKTFLLQTARKFTDLFELQEMTRSQLLRRSGQHVLNRIVLYTFFSLSVKRQQVFRSYPPPCSTVRVANFFSHKNFSRIPPKTAWQECINYRVPSHVKDLNTCLSWFSAFLSLKEFSTMGLRIAVTS